MADDQTGPPVVLAQRRLEPPDVRLQCAGQPPVAVRELDELRGVYVRTATLDVHRPIALLPQRVLHGLREHPLHQGVEPRRAHGDEDMRPASGRRGVRRHGRVVGHGQAQGRRSGKATARRTQTRSGEHPRLSPLDASLHILIRPPSLHPVPPDHGLLCLPL